MPQTEAQAIAELRRRNKSEYLTQAEGDDLLNIADKAIAFLNAWDKGQKFGGEIKELRAAISKLVGGRT